VICGGESGAGARLMKKRWARQLRDECHEADVAFFMKQMTGKAPIPEDLLVRQFPQGAAWTSKALA
jgi:protein gp37